MKLAELTEENWEQVVLLTTNPNGMPTLDEEFVASNAYSIAQAAYESGWETRVIEQHGRPVGFAMYGFSKDLNCYELCRLMIDHKYQGNGYGRHALALIADDMERRYSCDKIALSVLPENTPAKNLYERFGFHTTGETLEGEEIYVYDVPDYEIRPFLEADFDDFINLFYSYFNQDLDITCTKEQAADVCSEMQHLCEKKIAPLEILLVHGVPAGFIEYQVDTPQSDWCEKPGYGCLREVYISVPYRKSGLGRDMAAHAECCLQKAGAKRVYLTSDSTGAFWEKCGYKATGKTCEKNQSPIYEKMICPLKVL